MFKYYHVRSRRFPDIISPRMNRRDACDCILFERSKPDNRLLLDELYIEAYDENDQVVHIYDTHSFGA